jgi:hypothetical protein
MLQLKGGDKMETMGIVEEKAVRELEEKAVRELEKQLYNEKKRTPKEREETTIEGPFKNKGIVSAVGGVMGTLGGLFPTKASETLSLNTTGLVKVPVESCFANIELVRNNLTAVIPKILNVTRVLEQQPKDPLAVLAAANGSTEVANLIPPLGFGVVKGWDPLTIPTVEGVRSHVGTNTTWIPQNFTSQGQIFLNKMVYPLAEIAKNRLNNAANFLSDQGVPYLPDGCRALAHVVDKHPWLVALSLGSLVGTGIWYLLNKKEKRSMKKQVEELIRMSPSLYLPAIELTNEEKEIIRKIHERKGVFDWEYLSPISEEKKQDLLNKAKNEDEKKELEKCIENYNNIAQKYKDKDIWTRKTSEGIEYLVEMDFLEKTPSSDIQERIHKYLTEDKKGKKLGKIFKEIEEEMMKKVGIKASERKRGCWKTIKDRILGRKVSPAEEEIAKKILLEKLLKKDEVYKMVIECISKYRDNLHYSLMTWYALGCLGIEPYIYVKGAVDALKKGDYNKANEYFSVIQRYFDREIRKDEAPISTEMKKEETGSPSNVQVAEKSKRAKMEDKFGEYLKRKSNTMTNGGSEVHKDSDMYKEGARKVLEEIKEEIRNGNGYEARKRLAVLIGMYNGNAIEAIQKIEEANCLKEPENGKRGKYIVPKGKLDKMILTLYRTGFDQYVPSKIEKETINLYQGNSQTSQNKQ